MSRDRNDQDRKVPWPKRLRSKRLRPKQPERKVLFRLRDPLREFRT